MSKINKLITLATIFILLVSNLGNSLQVIAETTKPSDTKPYEETSFVSEKTEENLIVESDQPKESEETENKKNESNIEDDAESQTEDNSMSSIEAISGVNRYSYAESWEIGEGVDSYGLREWVSGNLKSYIDSALRGKTLGGNVGDKIEGIISFPSQMKIEGLTASNWNNQNTIILGGANGYYYFKNIRFSHDESIKISLSGTDTDSSRKIVIERVAISTNSIMSIGVEYSFTSKGTVSSNVGVKPINPGGVGNSIQFTINANPSTSVSFNDLTSVEQADIKKRMAEVIGTQVWRNNIFRGSRNDLPTSLPSLGWEIGDFYVLDMGETFSDISIDNGITIGGHISVINEPEVEYKDSAKGFMKHSYVDGQFRLERTKKGFINTQVVEWKNVKIDSSDLLYVNTQSQKILVRLDEPIVLDIPVNGYSGARGPEKFEVDVNNDLSINVGEKLDEEFIRENILKSAKLDNKEIPLEDVQIQSSSIDTSEPGKKALTVTFKENNSKFVGSSWKQLEVEKNINVDIEDRVITADAVPTSIPLGTDTKKLNPKDFVTNVKLSGKTLKESEYTVEKLTGLTSTVISNEKIQFKISLTSNTAITTTIDVPVSVVWGNSIRLKGAYSSAVSTLSLVQGTDGTYMIKGVLGRNNDGSTSQSMVNPSFKDRYIGIDYLNVNGQIQNGSNMTSYYHTEIMGTDYLTDAWENVESSKEVNLGDVVKLEHQEFMSYPSLVLLYTNNVESQPNKDKKMVNNTGYFEITENGFKQLNFNQLKNGKKFKIYMSDTKETLETKLKNNEFLTNEGYSSIEIVEFSTLPDNSKAGDTTGKIKVKEKLSNGEYVYYEYEVNFEVEDDRVITADGVSTSIPLGTNFDNVSPYDLVKDVKLGNLSLAKDEYQVSVQNTVSTDTVKDKTAKVLVTYKKDTSKTLSLDVPVKVLWGNSVVFGGYDYGGNGRTTAAFTLNTDSSPFITATQGGTSDDNSDIHSNFANKQYYTFNWFDLSNKQSILMTEDNMGTKYLKANGNDLKKDKLKEWGTNQIQEVNYGDIVRAWQLESNKNWLYEDEIRNSYNMRKNSVYYEITQTGYKPLFVNQANINKRTISIDETDEEIENKIEESIELPDGTNAKFIEHPSREKQGESNGIIRVSQTLASGKTIEYDYTAPFEVINDRLVVDTKEADVFLGTAINLIAPSTFIDSVKLGDQKLTDNDYKVEYVTKFDTSITGNPQVSLKITLNSDSKKFVEVTSKANVKYGSTIISRAYDTKDVDVSVSLLDNNGVPYLNANQGFGFSDYGGLLSRPSMSIYRDGEYNQILSVGYGTVKNNPKKLAEIWNQSFDKVDLEYGDVVKYSVNNYGNNTNSKGKNTWISRNESLVRETEGYYEAYYELTTSGYRLMNINQLELNNSNKVSLNTSKEEMDKNILSYINIPSHISNPQDYRMEFQSVDTSSSGKKTTTIKVYQKLQSGGEFMTTYSVNYTVNPEIEETSYDVEGNKIVETKKTSFDYGTQFKPSPTKYLEKDDNLYVYKGWLENTEEPGVDVPKEGIPSPTEKESKFYYIYEKADKYINVTIPTEMVFGTFDNTEKVKSNKYEIKNNSKELTTSVTLDSFQSVSTSVKLLGENDELDEKIDSARLNLLINDEPKIKGFNETKFDIELANIEPENKITIGINGEYYDKTSKTNIVEYNTTLKFKAISGN
ncbi:bacterial Ig-like domain-containing protein [Listeria monocytogenes]|nr:bacterial Ig-like domain-containing protein [Listeria monocytogenes]